ncbi:MAG TPA: tRNA (guanosine(46)-N7)-methyltransferase TrmB [Chitinophagaceae bacterium]|nr:tRNA (guanosine(46)-N7)-methyltransferase TrmB [Chitinophagaceae bacterium]
MGQKKLIRFEELKTFPNVLQYPEGMKGNWHLFFKNQNPIILDLACGKGEYAVGLGRLYPQKNFIGIDIKGNRIWRGAKTALQEGLKNVAFLRTQIDKVTDYFDTNEVSEIWITFPDPQLRLSKIKKRLTHPRFLRLYQKFLRQGGLVHLKTDSPDLYNFTKTVINLYGLDLLVDYEDVYSTANLTDELKIKTHYEALDIAQSNRVHYLQFKIDKTLPIEEDETLKNLFREKVVGEQRFLF